MEEEELAKPACLDRAPDNRRRQIDLYMFS
jgi:hypothetical protein